MRGQQAVADHEDTGWGARLGRERLRGQGRKAEKGQKDTDDLHCASP